MNDKWNLIHLLIIGFISHCSTPTNHSKSDQLSDDGRLEGRLNSDGIRPKKGKKAKGGGAEPLDEEGPKGILNDGILPKGGQKPKGGGTELLDDEGPKNGRNLNGLNCCSSLPDSSELLSSDAISDELFGASLCPLTKMAIVKIKAAIKNLLAIICDN